MAQPQSVISYFRFRGNDKAPLFEAKYVFDVEQMRKHPDYFECDASGKAIDGKSEALSKAITETIEGAVATAKPASRTLRLGAKTTRS